jgi:hypothetical protein
MGKTIRCFERALNKGKSYTIMDAGTRVVEIKKIVGTVGKCGELDENFLYRKRRDRSERSRRFHMAAAVRRFHLLPAIDLYLYRGEYYVVDGNRRVAAAKDMKIEFIDANVTEYVDRDDHMGMVGALLRRRFETETGIRNISLTHESGYGVLLEEIRVLPEEESIEVKARRWYNDTFLTASEKIKSSGLQKKYENLRTGDIYNLIMEFFRNYMDGAPPHTSFETLISGFMFAHGMSPRRLLRSLPLRIISALILGKGKRRRSTHRPGRPERGKPTRNGYRR